jgi:hypothetical protein
MDIAKVLQFAYPGKAFSLNGGDYEGLDWLDDSPKPTLKDIEDKYPDYLADIEKQKKLVELPTELDAVFNALPVSVRAQFFPLKASIKLAFEQGDTEAALEIIKIAQVPPELETAKSSLLALFDNL